MASFNARKSADKENKKKLLDNNYNVAGTSENIKAGRAIAIGRRASNQNRDKLATINANATMGKGKYTLQDQGIEVVPNQRNNVKKVKNVICSKMGEKKSTFVALVEQSKTFQIYEDLSNNNQDQNFAKVPVPVNQKVGRKMIGTQVIEKEIYFCSELELESQQIALDERSVEVKEEKEEDEQETPNITLISVSDLFSPTSNENIEYSIKNREFNKLNDIEEYQEDILKYFFESEKRHGLKPLYMRHQKDINFLMRKILVDWLVEVAEDYKLNTETLYLSIWYIDCFLSRMSVLRCKLQLVGAVALLIAAKYEEIYPPSINDFVYIADNTYTKDQLLRMEKLILKTLSFNLCTPTAFAFINIYDVHSKMSKDSKFLTLYICELSLLEADPFLQFLPSLLAAASHGLARYILGYNIWSQQLENVTTYYLEDLKDVCLHLCNIHKTAPSCRQQAIQNKYKNKKFNEISTIKAVNLTFELFDEIIIEYNKKTHNMSIEEGC